MPFENETPTAAEGHISAALESMYNMMVQMVNHRGSPSAAGISDELAILSESLSTLATQVVADDPAGPTATTSTGTTTTTTTTTAAVNGNVAAPPSPPLTSIPADIVEYVGRGRNPDIYTREFYELAIRNNQTLRGKSEAFLMFRNVLVNDLVAVEPELAETLGGMGFRPGTDESGMADPMQMD